VAPTLRPNAPKRGSGIIGARTWANQMRSRVSAKEATGPLLPKPVRRRETRLCSTHFDTMLPLQSARMMRTGRTMHGRTALSPRHARAPACRDGMMQQVADAYAGVREMWRPRPPTLAERIGRWLAAI